MNAKKARQDIMTSGVLALLCVYIFISAGSFRGESGFFPRIISVITGLLCLVQMAAGLWQHKKATASGQTQPVSQRLSRRFWVTTIGVVIYAGLIFVCGYFTATFIYLVASVILAGYDNKVMAVGVSASMVAIVYAIFVMMLRLRLPAGFLI